MLSRRVSTRIGLAGVVALAAMNLGCELLEPPPTPPEPASNWTVQSARDYRAFPLYWLGETYEGLPLKAMRITTDGDGVRHASFNYGEHIVFVDSGASWIPQLEVDIQPYCGFSPEEFLSYGEYYDEEPIDIEIRGVEAYVRRHSASSASLVLWTGGSSVSLSTWKLEIDIEQAARDLIPIAQDAGRSFEELPPPAQTEC